MGRTRRPELPWWAILLILAMVGLFLAFPKLEVAYDKGLSRLGSAAGILVLVLVGLVLVLMTLRWLAHVPLYRRARREGVHMTCYDVIGMRLRRVDAAHVIQAARCAREHNLPLGILELEAQFLCGGHIMDCVEALAEARRRGMQGSWTDITALDLAGRDVLAVVLAGHDPKGLVGSNRLPESAHRRL